MRIVGIDISRGRVSACRISENPVGDYQELFHETEVVELYASARGVAGLFALEPDAIVLEPTGMHYAKLWFNAASERGVEIYWVGHKQLARFREELGFEDKNDEQDAFALACYWWRYAGDPRRFVRRRDSLTAEVRSLSLRLQHLDRCRSPHINFLRQLLSWQFPEVARKTLQQGDGRPSLLLNWICDGGPKPRRVVRAYEKTCGMGIDERARFGARQIRELCLEEWGVRGQLRELLELPQFAPYRRVMDALRVPFKSQAILIAQIYPLSDFLDPEGKPVKMVSKGKKSGKPTTKHLSCRRFQKTLGCSPTERSSGTKHSKKTVSGSALCRKHIFLWLLHLERKQRPIKLRDPDAIAVRDRLNSLKDSGVPAQLARGRCAGMAARRLFYRLVEETGRDRHP
ncbi:MAG: transposase [Cyanobacteriota bacterium]|nr:transposase [Cyanobacteriota bacterium]